MILSRFWQNNTEVVSHYDAISKQTNSKVFIFVSLFEGNFTITTEWVTNPKLL